jgi:hypothetical protein
MNLAVDLVVRTMSTLNPVLFEQKMNMLESQGAYGGMFLIGFMLLTAFAVDLYSMVTLVTGWGISISENPTTIQRVSYYMRRIVLRPLSYKIVTLVLIYTASYIS